jgi:hypothetical protein
MSWSDANPEYRWHTPSSLVGVRRAEQDQNRVTSGPIERARQQELTAKGDGMGQPSPPELSPAMSGAFLFGAKRKGCVDVHETHGAKLACAMRASFDSSKHQPPTEYTRSGCSSARSLL